MLFRSTIFKNCVEGYLHKATDFYAQKKFRMALHAYDSALNNFFKLRDVLGDSVFNFVEINRDEVNPEGKNQISKLCSLAKRAQDNNFSNLKGINLLENSILKDLNDDGVPDGYRYFFSDQSKDKENISDNVFFDNNLNVYVYHLKNTNRSGWLALYFSLGIVPPDSRFILSFETKHKALNNYESPRLCASTIDNVARAAGIRFSQRISQENLGKDGWRKEVFVLETNDHIDIDMSIYLIAWQDIKGQAEIFIRKPKVEIGDNKRATSWSTYLN